MGVLRFDNAMGPNVAGNHFPNHAETRVNTIIGRGSKKVKAGVDEIKLQLKWVWKTMDEMVLATSHSKDGHNTLDGYYFYHGKQGHDIHEYVDFKVLVQGLMDNKQMEFYGDATPEEMDAYTSEEETSMKDAGSSFLVVIISGASKREGAEVQKLGWLFRGQHISITWTIKLCHGGMIVMWQFEERMLLLKR
ncbi:hypothetical protein GQ457_08G016580 [Hibiscus cannabinus]